MCLAALAIAQSERFPWLIASNRDEFFDRPAAPLAWWQPAAGPALLSGRDLSAGGTWLGLVAQGRLALVTNVREPGRHQAAALSRGMLVPQWLAAPADEAAAITALAAAPRNGFNFIAADLRADTALWFSNRPHQHQHHQHHQQPQHLGPGLYGLSNAALDTPWPKLTQLKQQLAAALHQQTGLQGLAAAAFAALANRESAPDAALPDTGLPLRRERQLSSAFIHVAGDGPAAAYGTRCSTVVVAESRPAGRRVHVFERSFDATTAVAGEKAISFDLLSLSSSPLP